MSSPSISIVNVDLRPGKPPMLTAEPNGDAVRWAAGHCAMLRDLVNEHGSLMVRGLGLRDAAGAGAVFRQLGNLIEEKEAFAPRHVYAQGVYSASKWPPGQAMCMHHELSYLHAPPGLILFACLRAATSGGATPVADSAAVLEALPAELVRRFERLGWLLIRNYYEEIGGSVGGGFGTKQRSPAGGRSG